ncbi:MAG: hypothetical protein CMH13_11295 [Martelella sp.]|uniref:hypothetical protein n=1 Tax=Martelella sp. TaxID=1969699 RepID=UPI000C3BF779|nr:hypothetical protein [Martelella sp.]MAU21104.1 hypothetical protein [Martelella sp.]|tara:strand:+ start:954 stop:1154 length:201 start_codon:yes stop_codon:yes gene_type:complete
MTVYVRILLYIVAGWMLSSGLINKEVERIITTDPVIATGVQALLGSAVALATGYWWKLAKRFGWKT